MGGDWSLMIVGILGIMSAVQRAPSDNRVAVSMTSSFSDSQSVFDKITFAGVMKPNLIESSIGILSQSGPSMCLDVGETSLAVIKLALGLEMVLNLDPKSENILVPAE